MASVPAARPAKWKLVECDPDKCTGCTVCEYICSLTKEDAFNAHKSRIRTTRLHPLINISITCRLCSPAPCVTACPRDALTQSEETGVIMVDDDKCDGCSWCIEACDYGAITLHPEKKVVRICDLCDGDPECVKWCPEEALDFVTRDLMAQKARITVTKKLFKEAMEAAGIKV
ncbi:MAG: 4Fe-4S dicluster domain-containing protein [Candidatus Bathyarchaeia archaeon]